MSRTDRRLLGFLVVALVIGALPAFGQDAPAEDTRPLQDGERRPGRDGEAQEEGEGVENVPKMVLSFVQRAWNYTLFTVGTEKLAVSQILTAILILVVGLFLSRRAAVRVHRLIVDKARTEEGVAASVEKGVFYFLLFVVVLFALKSVRIPLTIFAYLGGAVAIGLGFGAQNLINNFISGLILLLERPIKIGDIVEVEGVRGRITNVGARCSQVRRFDGIDMLVPNSAFLEKNVTNWTLSDKVLRFSVSVGVAYGSPTREVYALVTQAVEEHEKVLKYPEPVVLFEDFGDNALQFTAYFWLEVTSYMDYRVVASDLRFRIEELFHEAGITIAFPQRDVHLDSLRPVRVELVSDAPPTEENPSS